MNETTTPIILNVTSFSLGMPKDKNDEIIRTTSLQSIHKYFDNGKNTIIVEGDEDGGKTTLLKQFVKSRPQTAFSCFLNPVNKVSSSTELILHDLCLQIYWYINKEELIDLSVINLPFYQALLIELKRLKRKTNEFFYFVIDGLSTDAKKYSELIEYAFEILPLAEDGYKFLISGDFETFKNLLPNNNKIISTPFSLINFGINETTEYFSEFQLTKDEVANLWRESSGGVPGKLANFKRILSEEKFTVDKLLDELDSSSVYEYDWRKVENLYQNDQDILTILSFIAIDEKVYTPKILEQICNIKIDKIEYVLKSFSFVNQNEKGQIQFFSNKHKSFFAKKLTSQSSHVFTKNIDFLLSNRESTESLLDIPSYYEKLQKYNEIIEFISEDYLPKIISICETLPQINNKINLGLGASKKLNKDNDILRFSIQGSLVQSIEGLHVWESEIEARIALGDYDNALKLASSALLKEDRLRLLAKISKQRVRKGLTVDEAILDQLRRLYEEVDLQESSKNLAEIAGDLLYSLPDLAVNMMQKRSSYEGKSINDWLLTKLAISTVDSKGNNLSAGVKSVLNNDRLSKVNSALSHLYGNYSTSQIIDEVNSIEKFADKFLFIRLWLSENKINKDSQVIIDFALDLLLKNNSKEVLSVELLTDLSGHLNNISNDGALLHLTRKFMDFKEEAKLIGPTIEYFRFETNLIRVLVRCDYNSGAGLLTNIVKEALQIGDLLTKTECLALLKVLLKRIEEAIKSKKVHQYLINQVNSALTTSVQNLLKGTANHFDILADTLRILSVIDPEYAVKIAELANTEFRRHRLYTLCFTSYLESNSIKKIDFKILNNIYHKINVDVLKEDCIRVVLEETNKYKKVENRILDDLLPIIGRIEKAESPETRCYLLVQALILLYKTRETYSSLIKKLEKDLKNSWEQLESEISKIEIGFFIAADLSESNSELAEAFINLSKELKENTWADSVNTIELYVNSIKLLVRVFAGFVKSKQNIETEFNKIENLIDNTPSYEYKLYLWSYLARLLLSNEERNLFQRIIKEHIKPLFDRINDQQKKKSIFIEYLSDILYVNNSITTLKQVRALPEEVRDVAYQNILNYYLLANFADGDDESEKLKSLNIDDVDSILEILPNIVSDHILYQYISKLCKALTTSEHKTLTETQRKAVVRRLEEIIKETLPKPKFIKHPGYVVISNAEIIRLDRQKAKDIKYINKLLEDTKSIDNLSDRAFVLALLAEVLNSTKPEQAKELIRESLAIIRSIEISSEYIERVEHLAKILYRLDQSLWKECLRSAIEKTLHNNKDSVATAQRSLIDTAYRHDKEFAKNLITILDKEEVRNKSNKSQKIKKYFNLLEVKNKIINNQEINLKKIKDCQSIAHACSMALDDLNSSMIVTKTQDKMRQLLEAAIKLPLKESYSIFEFYFQNIIVRVRHSNDSKQILLPIFNSCFTLCNIVHSLSISAKVKTNSFLKTPLQTSYSTGEIFHPATKDSGLEFIKRWLSINMKDYVIIHDPYFDKEQLEILKIILDVAPEVDVHVLTNVKDNPTNSRDDAERIYNEYWKSISQQDPPFTKITIFATGTQKSPIHDRWILSNGRGLNLGTSLKSIGSGRDSIIINMSEDDSRFVENDILKKYITMQARDFKGEKLLYKSFVLS